MVTDHFFILQPLTVTGMHWGRVKSTTTGHPAKGVRSIWTSARRTAEAAGQGAGSVERQPRRATVETLPAVVAEQSTRMLYPLMVVAGRQPLLFSSDELKRIRLMVASTVPSAANWIARTSRRFVLARRLVVA